MFDITITSFIRNLTSMHAILEKAHTWQLAQNISDDTMVNARLALDQYPLAKQIQIMSDYAKKCGAVLCGVEAPSFEDDEKTIPELQARIDKTVAFLKTLSPDMVVHDLDTKIVPLPWMPGKGFVARYYVENYSIPQFYFHYTTAYSILRHYGLQIGKGDFMSGIQAELRDLA